MEGPSVYGRRAVKKVPYLRSRKRRGRWFHTYKRYHRSQGKEVEISLGVHGLHPDDPKVLAAWAGEHARWEDSPAATDTPKTGTFGWALDLYTADNRWKNLAPTTRKARMAIFRRYRAAQGGRPLSTITREVIEAALYAKGGHGAVNEYKALKPVFTHLHKLQFISKNPMAGLEIERPKTHGFATANADDIARFQDRWKVGSTERLIFDLALYTGAARVDLARLGPHNVSGELLSYRRQKSNTLAEVPLTPELRRIVDRTPRNAQAFITTKGGRPYAHESLGNMFGDAAREAGIVARLHGLRKAFCVYWAERGASTHQIGAMAGHMTLFEVERYTRAADRRRLVQLLLEDT